jgi:desulfoferrodoxin (superoxide reductase-like protein)
MTTRRGFFGLLGGAGAAAATGCYGTPPFSSGGLSDAWEQRAQQLEDANGVYSAADEGIWPGKAGNHVPAIVIDAASKTATVSSTHPMTEAHWLTTIYVRNQDGVVVHLAEFVVRGANAATAATTTFTIPAGTTSMTAYSYCNLHDAWSSLETPVS